MSASAESPDVAIVGGGIAGLVSAWRARQAGLSVTLLEREETGGAASNVAAGMLAPVAEAEFGPAGRRLLGLGLRSAQLWPAFAQELSQASGRQIELLQGGTLMVARDQDDADELERQLAFRASLGLTAERLRAGAAREREPALAPTVRLAVHVPEDRAVEPRSVLAALRRACELAGVRIREHADVESLELDGAGESVTGVALRGGERVAAAQVLVAAGAWSPLVAGLPERARMPVRPVKGQILRLRDPAGPGLLTHVLRFRRGGYLVPRGDGRYVLGATVEERGYELEPTAGGVYELLRDASEVLPGIDELRIEELSVGLRPGTPDNGPAIGPGALAGLVWATGHYRNGILLAPLTGELVAAALTGRPSDSPRALLRACAPARFAEDPPPAPPASARRLAPAAPTAPAAPDSPPSAPDPGPGPAAPDSPPAAPAGVRA